MIQMNKFIWSKDGITTIDNSLGRALSLLLCFDDWAILDTDKIWTKLDPSRFTFERLFILGGKNDSSNGLCLMSRLRTVFSISFQWFSFALGQFVSIYLLWKTGQVYYIWNIYNIICLTSFENRYPFNRALSIILIFYRFWGCLLSVYVLCTVRILPEALRYLSWPSF